MLFDEKEYRFCVNCAQAAELDKDTMLCKRKGPVRKDGCCRRFCYDPLRREPSPRRETLLPTDRLDFSL